MAAQIDKTPIYLELDTRRRLVFNLNAAIMLRNHGGEGKLLWDSVKEKPGSDGKIEQAYDINLENLRLYLWVCLHAGAMKERTPFDLSLEDVAGLIEDYRQASAAFVSVLSAVKAYYGRGERGEAKAPTA